MSTRKMLINAVFMVITIVTFFVLAKLLLFAAGVCVAVDQQTKTIATGLFGAGGFLCSLYVIYKN